METLLARATLNWLIWDSKLDNKQETILEIEKACFCADSWTPEDFTLFFKSTNNIGLGAYVDKKLVGYILYSRNKEKMMIMNLAVHPDFQRQQIATNLIDKLKGKLTKRVTKLCVHVVEDNLVGHLFFKKSGFLAINVNRNYYENGRDSYYMEYQSIEED